MSNLIYISKRCPHSKQLLITIYKNPMLKNMFKIISIEDSPVPPFIKTVPTLFNETNNSIISGNDLLGLIQSYSEQQPEPNMEPMEEKPKDEELAPWIMGEMGGNISSSYSFLGSDNPIQNSFELIGGSDTCSNIQSNGIQSNDNQDNKSNKRQLFDNDYEQFIKNRNEGIPSSTNRA